MKRRLANIAPKVQIEAITSNLNWQRSARLYATDIDQIVSCDLIINATGDAGTALHLGALANSNNKQFLSVEVFEGGIGCAIGRSVPLVDPAYSDGYAAYNRYCSELDVVPPVSGIHDYETQDHDGAILVADDASISITAGHTSRIALDLLDDLPIESPAWMLVGFKPAWIFSAHGIVHTLDVGPPLPITSTPEPSTETIAFSLELARSIAAEA